MSSDVDTVDFGIAVRGKVAPNVIALRTIPRGAATFDALALFLENNGGLDHTSFGKFKSSTPITGIEPGDPRIAEFFVQVTGVSDFSRIEHISDYGILLNPAAPEYMWIDAQVGMSEDLIGSTHINLRFVFEYA